MQKTLESVGLEDDIDLGDMVEELTMIDGIRPVPGGPFSALTPSMWPQEILAKLRQPEVILFELTIIKLFYNKIFQQFTVRRSKRTTRLSFR